jgi:hypothetical protein
MAERSVARWSSWLRNEERIGSEMEGNGEGVPAPVKGQRRLGVVDGVVVRNITATPIRFGDR